MSYVGLLGFEKRRPNLLTRLATLATLSSQKGGEGWQKSAVPGSPSRTEFPAERRGDAEVVFRGAGWWPAVVVLVHTEFPEKVVDDFQHHVRVAYEADASRLGEAGKNRKLAVNPGCSEAVGVEIDCQK